MNGLKPFGKAGAPVVREVVWMRRGGLPQLRFGKNMNRPRMVEQVDFLEEQLSEYGKHECYIWTTPIGSHFAGELYAGCYLIHGDRHLLEIHQIIAITPSGDFRLLADCLLVATRRDGVWDEEPPECLNEALAFINHGWVHGTHSSRVF
jgi:hypothetical protein